jgi:replicative DNA helicase
MLIDERDVFTFGEQIVLNAYLCHMARADTDWTWLCPADFSHDLHGRLYRHIRKLAGEGTEHNVATVLDSMLTDRRSRVTPAVREYVEWLADGLPLPIEATQHAFHAFMQSAVSRRLHALTGGRAE